MKLTLQRYCYADDLTLGRLWLDDDDYLHTLERPWVAGLPGGVPFESCVPDGSYDLLPHTRPDGTQVLALRNPAHHVYYTNEERTGRPGRYLILFHSANWVEEVVGCIAPGLIKTIANNKIMVRSSREAMAKLMAAKPTKLVIEPVLGTDV